MDKASESLQDLLCGESGHRVLESCDDLPSLVNCITSLIHSHNESVDSIISDLIDVQFLEDIKDTVSHGVPVYIGKTLRDIQLIIWDESGVRLHKIFLQYKGSKKLVVASITLPYSPLQDREYSYIEEVILAYRIHVDNLTGYFSALDQIDRFCTVVDPVNPTYKEDYRRIMLDDRIWLHVEVTPEGLATNIHLIGQSEQWQEKLQSGLLNWDHDEDIVENIMNIFDIIEFPAPCVKSASLNAIPEVRYMEVSVCSICLCADLGAGMGVPQPLCQNTACGVFFHRICLFQWLVACAGGRPPAFGVATGSCPTCIQPITCSDRDT